MSEWLSANYPDSSKMVEQQNWSRWANYLEDALKRVEGPRRNLIAMIGASTQTGRVESVYIGFESECLQIGQPSDLADLDLTIEVN